MGCWSRYSSTVAFNLSTMYVSIPCVVSVFVYMQTIERRLSTDASIPGWLCVVLIASKRSKLRAKYVLSPNENLYDDKDVADVIKWRRGGGKVFSGRIHL